MISWLVTLSIPVFFITCLLTVMGLAFRLFSHGNLFIIFTFSLLFGFSIIAFAFLAMVFVKSRPVAIVTAFLWLYIVNQLIMLLQQVSSNVKFALSLVSPIAFSLGFLEIINLDINHDGVHFSNVRNGDFSIASAFGMMALDTLLYGILAWYFYNVFPGNFGVPKPYLFFLKKSYWVSGGRFDMLNLQQQISTGIFFHYRV